MSRSLKTKKIAYFISNVTNELMGHARGCNGAAEKVPGALAGQCPPMAGSLK